MSDKFNTCNICRGGITVDDQVIVTQDATCIEEAEGAYNNVYEEDSGWDVTYRGVYCPTCWDTMLKHEDTLYKQYHKMDTTRIASYTGPALKNTSLLSPTAIELLSNAKEVMIEMADLLDGYVDNNDPDNPWVMPEEDSDDDLDAEDYLCNQVNTLLKAITIYMKEVN